MKHLKTFGFTLLFAQFAFAGAVDGGGGTSVVCRDTQGNIVSARVLDLYEAEKVMGLNLKKPQDFQGKTAQEIANYFINRLDSKTKNEMSKKLQVILSNYRILPSDVGLEPINDALPVIKPKNCKIEQAVNFYTQEKILFDREIWEAMDEYNKAGLLIHEAAYWMDREEGATNSRRSRHIVGHLFLEKFLYKGVMAEVNEDPKIICKVGERDTFGEVPDPIAVLYTSIMPEEDGLQSLNIFSLHSQKSFVAKKILSIENDPRDLLRGVEPGDPSFESGRMEGGTQGGIESDKIKIDRVEEPVFHRITGEIIPGKHLVSYYFSSESMTHPGLSVPRTKMHCAYDSGYESP